MTYSISSIPRLLGLNLNEDTESLQTGELVQAQNVGRFGNMVGTRPGVVALASGADYENALSVGSAIRGAHEYRQNFDQGRALIVIAENPGSGTFPAQKIYYEDDARLDDSTVPTITHAQDYIYTMATHANVLYGTGGPPGKNQVVTEDLWSWDGDQTTPSAPSVITLTDKATGATLYPKFIKTWRNWLLVNGLQQSAANLTNSNNPSVTRYADFGTNPATDVNWPDGNTVGFSAVRTGLDSYGENYSTGFGEYTDNRGDFLILLSNRQLAAVQGDTVFGNDFVVRDTIANGCVHQRAFVNLGLDFGDAIYVSERGIHSLRQSQEHGDNDHNFLSWKIRPLFNTLNKLRLHHACATFSTELGFVLFAFSSSAQTTEGHDLLMALDIQDPETLTARNALWYGPWRLGGGLLVNHLASIRETDEKYNIYLFTTDGQVLKFSDETYADLTNGYTVELETKQESYGNLLQNKRFGDTSLSVMTPAVGGYNISMKTIIDYGRRTGSTVNVAVPSISGSVVGASTFVGTAVVGASSATATRKVYTSGRGPTLGYRFTHSGVNQPFFLGRIDQEVAVIGETAGSR